MPANREGVLDCSSISALRPPHGDARLQILGIDEEQHFPREREQEAEVGNEMQLGEGNVALRDAFIVENFFQLEGGDNLEEGRFEIVCLVRWSGMILECIDTESDYLPCRSSWTSKSSFQVLRSKWSRFRCSGWLRAIRFGSSSPLH